MKNFRQHAIEYVAMLMAESITSIDEQAQYLEKINEREGFTIDYISQGLPDGHWLRVEGVKLSTEEMARAIALAKERY
jgi:hypothetical protein